QRDGAGCEEGDVVGRSHDAGRPAKAGVARAAKGSGSAIRQGAEPVPLSPESECPVPVLAAAPLQRWHPAPAAAPPGDPSALMNASGAAGLLGRCRMTPARASHPPL